MSKIIVYSWAKTYKEKDNKNKKIFSQKEFLVKDKPEQKTGKNHD